MTIQAHAQARMRYQPSLARLAYASPAGLGEESVQVYLPHAVFRTIVQSNGTGGYATSQPKGMLRSEDSPGGMMIQKSSAAPMLNTTSFIRTNEPT